MSDAKHVAAYPLSYPNSHCIYNEQFSRTCLHSSNPKCSQQLGSIMTLCGLLTSIWSSQCEISQFDGIACWKRFSPLSPPQVAMTTSSSLATYLCKGSREFAPELSLPRCDNRYGVRNVKILYFSPHVKEYRTVLPDSGFHAMDSNNSRFWIPVFGFWIPNTSGNPDSQSFIPDSKAQDSGFHKTKNFPNSGIRITLGTVQ